MALGRVRRPPLRVAHGDAVSAPTLRSLRVRVQWDLPSATTPPDAWAALMAEAKRDGIVRDHDDGRGQRMWYTARRGGAERALRARCVALLGAPADVVVGGMP